MTSSDFKDKGMDMNEATSTIMTSTDSDMIRTAFTNLKEVVSFQDSKEFMLPQHYIKLGTVKLDINLCEDKQQDIDSLHVIGKAKEQEFKLPESYFSFLNDNISSKVSSDGNYQNFTGHEQNRKEEVHDLHKAIQALGAEVRYQCVIIRDFNLPSTFFSEEETEDKVPVIPKKSVKRQIPKRLNTRASRQKDRERKRLKRATTSSLTSSDILTNVDDTEITNTKWQKMYRENSDYRNRKKEYGTACYHNDLSYQSDKREYSKRQSKEKYDTVSEYKENREKASKMNYKNDLQFKAQVKDASKRRYKNDLQFQAQVKDASKRRYKTDHQFQARVKDASKMKYRTNLRFQSEVKKARKKRYSTNKNFQDRLKMLYLLRYRQNVLFREKYRQRLRDQYQREKEVRRKILLVQKRRLANRQLSKDAIWFINKVREGPCYVCSVCLKFKFRKQVLECDRDKYAKKSEKSNTIANHCFSTEFLTTCTAECKFNCNIPKHKLWICHSCHQHILKGELPKDANINGLQLQPIPEHLKSLNRLERQLISQRIPFMKIVQLPKGNQRGVIGPCVSVPTDIEKTTKVLPHCEDDSQLLRCKLKRKLSFKGHSQYEFVSTKKIKESLEYLKENNSLYNDISINPTWQNSMKDITEVDTDQANKEVEDDDAEEEQEDQNTRDRGLPSDTCLQPVDIGQEMLDQHFNDIFCVAPGEGKTPVTMMQEYGNEAMSFPVQFPEGCEGSYDHFRQERITRTGYFHARLIHADNRFSSDSAYIFYAQYLTELEQVMSKVSIAMRKSSGKDTAGNIITANMLSDKDQLKKTFNNRSGV